MSATKDKVIDELNEEQARLGQAPRQDREQGVMDCIQNLTQTCRILLSRIDLLQNRVTALELHAKHQDQVRQFPAKEV